MRHTPHTAVALAVFALAGCQSAARLKPVDLHSSLLLARYESHTTISASGWLHSVMSWNKTSGPNNTVGPPKVEVREGQLSATQKVELAKMFAGWDSLAATYSGVPDSGQVEVTYGNRRVTGGDLPERVRAVVSKIEELARSMPAEKAK